MERKISIAVLATAILIVGGWALAEKVYLQNPSGTNTHSQGEPWLGEQGRAHVMLCPNTDGGCPATPTVNLSGMADGGAFPVGGLDGGPISVGNGDGGPLNVGTPDGGPVHIYDGGGQVVQMDGGRLPMELDGGVIPTDPATRPAADAGDWQVKPSSTLETWVDIPSLAAATYYYPPATGTAMTVYTSLSCQYVFNGTGGATITLWFEASNDNQTWSGVTPAGYNKGTNTSGATSVVVAATTGNGVIDFDSFNNAYARVKITVANAAADLVQVFCTKYAQ